MEQTSEQQQIPEQQEHLELDEESLEGVSGGLYRPGYYKGGTPRVPRGLLGSGLPGR